LKALSGLTPYEFICKCWTSEPDRFILDPIHQMPGLNISDRDASALLGLSRAALWRRVSDGTLPKPIRIGGATRWRRDELIAAVEAASARRLGGSWPDMREKMNPGALAGATEVRMVADAKPGMSEHNRNPSTTNIFAEPPTALSA
jgi:predicted DNA-binding transcriptional regulator AlpA